MIAIIREYVYRILANEISRISDYCDKIIFLNTLSHDDGLLNKKVKHAAKATLGIDTLPQDTDCRAIIMNGNFNYDSDIQNTLVRIKTKLNRDDRLIVVLYNPYLSWLYQWLTTLKLRRGPLPTTFITRGDLQNICKISGYDLVRIRPCVGFLTSIPVIRWLALTAVAVLRPVIQSEGNPSISVLIPARNEKGNIQNALERMPRFPGNVEVVFVEGHSNDGTWEEIERVSKMNWPGILIKKIKQTGKGKGDAVRAGFDISTGDLLTILDADLTMPPEMLIRFYNAYQSGLGNFINGSRLVYPMENEAMRFLNRLGNAFFAKSLSFVLEAPLGDSLCGTKLMSRRDWGRMQKWRKKFGEFDPFGDFDMIFPSAVLALGSVDIPVAYKARTYGSTNISRFRNGFELLRMTLIGFFRIRC